MSGVVVVLGSVNVDVTAVVERLPRPGETVSGGTLQRGHGGKGANQAVAAVRAGASVRFVGAVGQDADGDAVVATLAGEGVDVSGVRRVDAPTGTALICVDAAGENQIAVAPGANSSMSADGIDWGGAAVAMAQLEAPAEVVAAFFEQARAHGVRTVLNAAPIRTGAEDRIHALLDLVDVAVVNRIELNALVGPGGGALPARARSLVRAAPPRAVLVTLGGSGVTAVAADGGVLRVPGHDVDALDTVGAGDAFCGALAAALAQGRSDDEAIGRANAAGAVAATRPGARSAPTASEIDALLGSSTDGPA